MDLGARSRVAFAGLVKLPDLTRRFTVVFRFTVLELPLFNRLDLILFLDREDLKLAGRADG